jgi:hypothetical protein
MATFRVRIPEFLSRLISLLERRAPESPPWSASLGGLLLGGAMLYHVSVTGNPYSYTRSMVLARIYRSVTLSPVQTAVLLLTGIGSLAFAGWIRVSERGLHVFVGTASGALVSFSYVRLLDIYTPASGAYPLVHSYRATVLASVLFGIALISIASPGTWREPKGLQRALVGADPRRLVQWGAAGVLLFVVAGGITALSQQPFWPGSRFVAFEILKDVIEDGRLIAAAVFASPLAAYAGYRRDGLLASWIPIAGAGSGTWVALSVTNHSTILLFERWGGPVSAIWEFATTVILVALIFGTISTIIGVAIRQIQSSGVLGEAAIRR